MTTDDGEYSSCISAEMTTEDGEYRAGSSKAELTTEDGEYSSFYG
jgi:hypothetical protein